MKIIPVVLVLFLACGMEPTTGPVAAQCKELWEEHGRWEGVALVLGCDKKPDSAPPDASVWSKKKCNQAMKTLLLNPLSADFKGLAGMGGASTRLPGPTPRWKVSSHVDTKNVFGATKRTAFKCTVEHVGGDRWKVIDLDFTDLGVK